MAVMELWRRRDLEGTVKPEYIDGNFFTQDSVGNLVGVKCYKDGAEVALTGSVTGYCVLPSGETVSVAGTRSGNQASILVPQSALAYTGPLGITLKLIDGNTITMLMRIIVVVYRSKTDTVITPSSQIITDWANQISAALQEVEDASAAQDVKIADLKSAIAQRGIPSGGASGQSLRKRSGTDYDVEWASVGLPTDAQTAAAVSDWLDEHPEATTTVQDKSIGINKLVNNVLNFVTPEMFGAVGDGVTDDANAIELASAVAPVYCGKKQYYIGRDTNLIHGFIGGRFIVKNDSTIYAEGDSLQFWGCDFSNDALVSSGRGNWILVIRNSANPCITQCVFHDAVSCVYISRCKNPIISENVFKNIPQTALNEGGNGYGTLFVECENIIVTHNNFINVARHSIYLSHDETSTYNKTVTISENNFIWEPGHVIGNTSGFETTIMIRASLDVSIKNNYFSGVYTFCTINRQTIKVDGVDTFTGSKRVTIDGNRGTFKFLNRHDGVVFLSGSRTDEQESAEDITVKNNIVDCTDGYFVVADHYHNLRILNNKIKITTTDSSYEYNLVHCKLKRCDLLENLEIADNDIEFTTSGSLFMIYANDESATRLTLGDYIVHNNRVKNIYALGRIPAGYTYNKFVIADNILDFVGTRDYFNSPTIAEFYAKGNLANGIHGLYIGTPTKVMSTDPIFNKYSAVNRNPTEYTLPGSINVLADGSIYIRALDTWVPMQQAT